MSETTIEVPSRQEMFNRAWNGLKGQGWQQAMEDLGNGSFACLYTTKDKKHCAWGWVDREADGRGTVYTLAEAGVGIAGQMLKAAGVPLARYVPDLVFAKKLQEAHDQCGQRQTPAELEGIFRAFAAHHGLTIPE